MILTNEIPSKATNIQFQLHDCEHDCAKDVHCRAVTAKCEDEKCHDMTPDALCVMLETATPYYIYNYDRSDKTIGDEIHPRVKYFNHADGVQ